jgi:hypothetical protein
VSIKLVGESESSTFPVWPLSDHRAPLSLKSAGPTTGFLLLSSASAVYTRSPQSTILQITVIVSHLLSLRPFSVPASLYELSCTFHQLQFARVDRLFLFFQPW